MIKKFLVFTLIFGGLSMAYSQEQKTNKKVVIINKTNDNGKITETRQEAEGDEAEKLIMEMNPNDVDNINVTKDGNHNVISITKSISKITEANDKGKKVKVITIDGDNVKEIDWEGEGQMPDELSKELKNVKIKKSIDRDNMTITIDAEGDEKGGKSIVVTDAGKKKNKMLFVERDDHVYGNGKERKLSKRDFESNKNKATLGVTIDDTDDGVIISDIVDGSAAAKSGLRRGDTILKINDKYIFTADGLLKALRPFNPGDKVKVRYIRDGKEKSIKAVLSGR